MKSKKYWEDRILETTNQIYDDLDRKNIKLKQFYKIAIDDLDKEISSTLSKINSGKPSLSDMYKFNRLNNLKSNMTDILETLGENVEKHTRSQIINVINEGYKNIGGLITTNFFMPSEVLIEKLMQNPWSGEFFSDRIWENQKALNKKLNKTLKNGLIQGKAIDKISKELYKAMGSNFENTQRLVRTETMHFLNESCKKRYKDADIKYIEVLAAEDERLCDICGEEHLKKYKIDEAPVLPLHPNCRCTIVPVVY